MTKEGQLRVWWIPQVPMKSFYVNVENQKEAIKIIKVLGDYDNFQFENKIKPDFSNAGGLEVFEGGEWCEYYSEDGMNIDEIMGG